MANKVLLITGASSGIGKAAALEMLKKGWTVYGGARRLERLKEMKSQGLKALQLDVTDEQSRKQAIGTIVEQEGRLDGLVNCAGYGSYGAIEDVPEAEAKRQFDVNVFGLAAMCREALPVMRSQGKGRIVNISSMGGRIYTPMGGWYFASKHAVEALSDCLRHEVRPLGIQVSVIQPGMILSEWSGISLEQLEKTSGNGPYAGLAKKMAKILKFGYREHFAGKPEVIGRLVRKALTADKPKIRYSAPWDAKLLLFLRKYAPESLFDAICYIITKA
ncbi:MAG: SDR family NAD(P)-dependent oxidoreductase [bacterium]|nr:SDR family NAD(P)-dependent oxidoreductase [bacterium]